MRKGQRPVRHYRRIKTKKGIKKVLINKSVKHKQKVKGVIKPKERKIFTLLSNPDQYDKEFGGAIDFDKKGKIENINIMPGEEMDVFLPPDYEVQYHTHPDKNQSPPSPEDVIALLGNNKQQAEIIFRNGEAFVIIKTPKTKSLTKIKEKELKNKLEGIFYSSFGTGWNNKYKRELEKLGFIVNINKNPKTQMNIKVVPVEPKKKIKKRRHIKWDSLKT